MDRSFLIGADENVADIVDWWLYNKNRWTPDIPVQIADFGLSESTRQKLMRQGHTILPILQRHKGHVWFNKPRAMLCSKSEITLWMDVDTEIMADISDVFDLAKADAIGLCQDQYYHSVGRPMHNSGVVLYAKRPRILFAWDAAIAKSSQRGDQEVLQELLQQKPEHQDEVFDLPDRYNYVRLKYQHNASGVDDLRVVHWTGPAGDRIIRGEKKMGRMNLEGGTKTLGHDYKGDENQYRPKEENGSQEETNQKKITIPKSNKERPQSKGFVKGNSTRTANLG